MGNHYVKVIHGFLAIKKYYIPIIILKFFQNHSNFYAYMSVDCTEGHPFQMTSKLLQEKVGFGLVTVSGNVLTFDLGRKASAKKMPLSATPSM